MPVIYFTLHIPSYLSQPAKKLALTPSMSCSLNPSRDFTVNEQGELLREGGRKVEVDCDTPK